MNSAVSSPNMSPDENSNVTKARMPKGIPYILGNEMAERFSYYGMKAILSVFMTDYLMNASGKLDVMNEHESHVWFHTFGMGVYFFPLIGSIIADVFWGKYKTILLLSIVYCLGHLALSIDDTRMGLAIGLTLIAIGSGGIKPCVSANVGDQFTDENKELIPKVFNYFYLSINLGSFISTLLTPLFLEHLGPQVAFGIPGALMLLATVIFYLGKKKYKVVPPTPAKEYFKTIVSKDGRKALGNLALINLFFIIFWSLLEQTGSSWVQQAKSPFMNKTFSFIGNQYEVLPSQIQAVNPILVLVLVPLFSVFIYPYLKRKWKIQELGLISIGFFMAFISFVLVTWMEIQIVNENPISIMWQVLAYVIITASEVLAYGTGLAFSYTQAPNSMKSFVMGLFLLSIAIGNLFVALVNLIPNFQGPSYFAFFALLMLVASILFIFVARSYQGKTYIQGA
jgi:POT family proton-dependent oligopeptide transporter